MNLTPPLPHTYWVEPGWLLAGPHPLRMPGAPHPAALQALISAGITAFVDLSDPDELGGAAYPVDFKVFPTGADLRYYNLPFRDFATPTVPEMRAILDLLGTLQAQRSPAYIHCYAGVGRTGTAVGCLLAQSGFPGPAALERLQQLRAGLPAPLFPSPETKQQRAFVLSWPPAR
jgi:protein-tyrosine phosphatase